MAPWARPASTLARLGAKILALTTPFTDQVMWSITCGSKQHPYPDPLLEDIRQILHPGHHHTHPSDSDHRRSPGALGSHPPLTGSVAPQE